jgi:hypothetical protein
MIKAEMTYKADYRVGADEVVRPVVIRVGPFEFEARPFVESSAECAAIAAKMVEAFNSARVLSPR